MPDPYSQDPYQQPPQQHPQQYPPQYPPQYPVQYPVSGAPQQYPVSGPPQSYPPGPYGYGYGSPGAYQVDPATGLPLSDKSKVTAGLLQLIPGFCLGIGGIGRLYMGHVAIGVVQLVLGVIGLIGTICAALLIVPIVVLVAAWIWSVVDGIVILAGRPVDAQGRPLRS